MSGLLHLYKKKNMTQNNKGILAALGAFSIWGLLPLYWKTISSVIPVEILCHR
jgi:chloramphenicol-sensitive protein RarD